MIRHNEPIGGVGADVKNQWGTQTGTARTNQKELGHPEGHTQEGDERESVRATRAHFVICSRLHSC